MPLQRTKNELWDIPPENSKKLCPVSPYMFFYHLNKIQAAMMLDKNYQLIKVCIIASIWNVAVLGKTNIYIFGNKIKKWNHAVCAWVIKCAFCLNILYLANGLGYMKYSFVFLLRRHLRATNTILYKIQRWKIGIWCQNWSGMCFELPREWRYMQWFCLWIQFIWTRKMLYVPICWKFRRQQLFGGKSVYKTFVRSPK